MPEYAELHASAHSVMRLSSGHMFTAAEVREVAPPAEPRTLLRRAVPEAELDSETAEALTRRVGSSGPGQRVLSALAKRHEIRAANRGRPLPGSERFARFALSAAHRGKEVAVVLSRTRRDDAECPTCAAVLGVDDRGIPKCSGHGAAMRKTKARRDGREYYCCSRQAKCGSFVWVDECPRRCCDLGAAHRRAAPRSSPRGEEEEKQQQQPVVVGDLDTDDAVVVTFRRGMRGRFELLDEDADDGKWKAAQVVFWRDDGKALAFVDRRVRRGDRAIWHLGGFGPERSPDPLWETAAWRAPFFASSPPHVVGAPNKKAEKSSFSDAAFDLAICELMLDQRWFNGVGNYLRAEILDLARIPPFDMARDVLSNETTREALLAATTTVLKKAVLAHRSRKRLQLSVFRMRFATRELDAHGRTIWFRRERGALPPPDSLENTPWHRVVFHGVADGTPREDVLAFFQRFGDLTTFWVNPRLGYGSARYTTVAQAAAAVDAAEQRPLIFGKHLVVSYARRLRNHARQRFLREKKKIASSPSADDDHHQDTPSSALQEEEDDDDPPTSTDEEGDDYDDASTTTKRKAPQAATIASSRKIGSSQRGRRR